MGVAGEGAVGRAARCGRLCGCGPRSVLIPAWELCLRLVPPPNVPREAAAAWLLLEVHLSKG